MEIKILCSCGTKYGFEVEPVQGRMPAPVSCPACGADGTAQANEILRNTAPPIAPIPAASPPAPVPPPPPVAVRVNRPPPPPVPMAVGADAVPPPPMAPRRPAAARAKAEPKSSGKAALIAAVVFLCVVVGASWLGYKWFKRMNILDQMADAVGSSRGGGGEAEGPKNLWYDDAVVLFIKHTNHLEVAQACKDFWSEKLHKSLTLLNTAQEYEHPGEYELIPAHNGYVRIVTQFDWPEAQFEGLALDLSQRFQTQVFEWRSEHVADTYHFGVYQQGVRKFHAKMDVKVNGDDFEEIVTTEGNDFAIANGYKPGTNGFKEFDALDADKITQHLGMKLGDEPEGTELKGMLMREGGK